MYKTHGKVASMATLKLLWYEFRVLSVSLAFIHIAILYGHSEYLFN